MASLNKVLLIGNLTRDPELRYTQDGTAVADFGLAINRRFKGRDGQQRDETCFVDVTVWAKQAEVACEYLSKGRLVFVEGRLRLDTWEKEGQKRSKLSVVAQRVQFLGGRGGQGKPAPERKKEPPEKEPLEKQPESPPEPTIDEDDIPF